MRRLCISVLCFLFAGAMLVRAQSVPSLINYQGRLTDAAGMPLPDGAYRVAFKLWNDPTLTSTNAPTHLLWGREYDVTLVQGTFNVILGAGGGTAVPGAAVNDLSFAFGESNRFLGLTITQIPTGPIAPDQQREILPRQQLLSVPFAVTAASVIPGSITSTSLANASIEDRHIKILSKLTSSDGTKNPAVLVDAAGRVGIGTNIPSATLDVAGTLQIAAMAQQSLGSNGYVRIGELIIQWGQESRTPDIGELKMSAFFVRTLPGWRSSAAVVTPEREFGPR